MLKYIVPGYPFPTLYFGVANVVANGLIMLRYASFSQTDCVKCSYPLTVLWSFGYPRIWRMITRTICRCKASHEGGCMDVY